MSKIVKIDDLMYRCGYSTRETDANNGYGCNHPDNEVYENLYRDEDGYTHRGYDDDPKKTKTRQGMCFSFSCPIAALCTITNVKEIEPEDYKYIRKITKNKKDAESYVEHMDLVVISDELYNQLFY